jgi:hypothetical protein
MKIRKGFISNSSTSSFICGKDITIEQATKIMKKVVEASSILDLEFFEKDYTIFKADDIYGSGWDEWYGSEIKMAVSEKRIIVEGVSDNVIPYELFDSMEYFLNAKRLHFG